MEQELYSLGDAAEILRVQAHVINYMCVTGKIPEPRRVGGRRLFTIEELSRIGELLKLNPELWKGQHDH